LLESNSKLLEIARFTPDGQFAENYDPVMLLSMWCFHLANKQVFLKHTQNETVSSESSPPINSRSSSPLSAGSSTTSSPTSCSPVHEDHFLNGSPPASQVSFHDGVLSTVISKSPYTYPHDVYIAAGMGKPAFPISPALLEEIDKIVNKLRKLSREAGDYVCLASTMPQENGKGWRDNVSELNAVSDYGHPQGDLKARTRMAKALSRWYFTDHSITAQLSQEDVLYTVGEVAALHGIFSFLNDDCPNGRIVTPFPFYSLYRGTDKQNNLHPIYITHATDYKLTAACLEKSLIEAERLSRIDGRPISAFLFCDPNNPLGTVMDREEWFKIAVILRKYPNTPIILDECYTTMRLDAGRCASLLTIAYDLKDRLIVLRSATKALSAAGMRMAVTIIPNKKLMAKVVAKNVGINGHAPDLLQAPFAAALEQYNLKEHKVSNHYYREGVEYVAKRLKDMGAALPGNYQPTGAFYIMADLHELIGSPLPPETKQVLGESLLHTNKIQSDVGIVYSLLFRDKVMVAAGSFFGLPATWGWVRITASRGDAELKELMDRIESRLKIVRLEKINKLMSEIRTNLETLERLDSVDTTIYDRLSKRFSAFEKDGSNSPRVDYVTSKGLKQIITDLKILADDVTKRLPKGERAKKRAAYLIYAVYRGYKVRQEVKDIRAGITAKYLSYIDQKYKGLPTIQAAMYKLRSYDWIKMEDCRKLRLEAITELKAKKEVELNIKREDEQSAKEEARKKISQKANDAGGSIEQIEFNEEIIQRKEISLKELKGNYLPKHSIFNRVHVALTEDKQTKHKCTPHRATIK
jgi:aspartate/methionine/tyrosine aminotransferase